MKIIYQNEFNFGIAEISGYNPNIGEYKMYSLTWKNRPFSKKIYKRAESVKKIMGKGDVWDHMDLDYVRFNTLPKDIIKKEKIEEDWIKTKNLKN